MQLKEIYRPVKKELAKIERMIRRSVERTKNGSILEISQYLFESGGKRLRPALVTLSAKAALGAGSSVLSAEVIEIASAVELIHLASLIHDDVVDHSSLRHHRPTINSKWGEETSLILGDYLYSVGFDLISSCRNFDILTCVSHATRMMCEGELVQVCERDNLDILKDRYIMIVKNKTANLFAASCQAGALAVGRPEAACGMLKEYGLNFGIAFQIVDDCLDLIGNEKELGKTPGADFKMGELTLPVLNLLAFHKDRDRVQTLISEKDNQESFRQVRRIFVSSRALTKTKDDASFYVGKAKKSLGGLEDSLFKQSLFKLADYVLDRIQAQPKSL